MKNGKIGARYRTIFPSTGTMIPISMIEKRENSRKKRLINFSSKHIFFRLYLIARKNNIQIKILKHISGMNNMFFMSIKFGRKSVLIIEYGIQLRNEFGFPFNLGTYSTDFAFCL